MERISAEYLLGGAPDSDPRSRLCLIILETDMHDIRQVVEERVLKWPVGAKKMMFWLSCIGIVEKPALQ